MAALSPFSRIFQESLEAPTMSSWLSGKSCECLLLPHPAPSLTFSLRAAHAKDASSTSTASAGSSTVCQKVEGGLLTIKLVEARGLQLPEGVELSSAVASNGSRPVSVGGSGAGHKKRESVMRTECS